MVRDPILALAHSWGFDDEGTGYVAVVVKNRKSDQRLTKLAASAWG